MSSKNIKYGSEAREALKSGIDKTANAVKVTLGPKGKNVVIQKTWGGPIVTKDGVSVAKEIELKDPFEQQGAKLCQQVASKTNDVAGDGTTTATVLAQAMVESGMQALGKGYNPVALRTGIELAGDKIIEYINKIKQNIDIKDKDKVAFVSTISGNDKEVGEIVSKAFITVGYDGAVTCEEGKSVNTELVISEGMRLDRGYVSPWFINNPNKAECVLENPLFLLVEKRLTSGNEMVPILEAARAQSRPLLVIADDLDAEALATFVLNIQRGVITGCAIKTPGFGDRKRGIMTDIALLTGAKLFTEDSGTKLESLTAADFGSAKRVVITKEETAIVDGNGDKQKVSEHIQALKEQAENVESKFDKEKLTERVAKLVSGVAVIKIGASTEAEMAEKKYRYEDAINATKAALEDGIVPGGGSVLISAAHNLIKERRKLEKKDKNIAAGFGIVLKALEAPAHFIAENAGYDGLEVVRKTQSKTKGIGFNATTGKYVDMIHSGVIDPAKVTKLAVQAATSIAGLVLTTETLVVDEPEERKNSNQEMM